MRRHDVAAKLHHYCGLLVVLGVIAWVVVKMAALKNFFEDVHFIC